jgi:hypothetical protein
LISAGSLAGACYSSSMVDVKTAVDNAVQYAHEWLGSPNALLEEVEASRRGDQDVWLVTLSIPRRYPPTGRNALGPLGISDAAAILYGNREFKVFEVDGQTGDVRSMKIREMSRI